MARGYDFNRYKKYGDSGTAKRPVAGAKLVVALAIVGNVVGMHGEQHVISMTHHVVGDVGIRRVIQANLCLARTYRLVAAR